MLVGCQETITLGETFDFENSNDIKLETFEVSKNSLPSFMKFKKETKEYSITPSIRDKIGKYQIVIRLTDCYGAQKTYKFFVEIYKSDLLFQNSGNS